MKYLIAMLLALIIGCVGHPPASPEAPPKTLTLIAMNDWHGALYETPDPDQEGWAYGGLPTFKAMMDEIRGKHGDVLLVDGGDSFQGAWPINASKGKGAVEALNLLGVDAASVGNHEFDYGPSTENDHPLRGALLAAVKGAPFKWLAANVYEKTADGKRGPRWAPVGIQPWTMFKKGDVTVAVIGLSTQETPSTTRSTYVQDLLFIDPVEAVKNILPEIKEQGPDVIVVTGHLTGSCSPPSYLEEEEGCTPDGEIGRLLTELPRGTIDVIVAGHEHTVLRQRVGDTFVLESRHKGHALTGVTLHITPEGVDPDQSVLHPIYRNHHPSISPGCFGGTYPTTPISVGDSTLSPSDDAIRLLKDLENRAGSLCDVVGCAEAMYKTNREEESPLGRLVAKAMHASMPEASIAVTNSGGLRANLPSGTILRKDVHDVMPFDNKLMLVEISGEDLLTMLEIGTSGAHGMLQMVGLEVTLHPEKLRGRDLNQDGQVENWEKTRLCKATANGKAISPRKSYSIVTSDFLLTGGDHLGPAFKNARILKDGPTLRESIQSYIKATTRSPGDNDSEFKCLVNPEKLNERSVRIEACKLP